MNLSKIALLEKDYQKALEIWESSVTATHDFLKEKDNVQYLEGYVDPRNIFSIKILEKSGFIKTHEEDNDYVYRKQIK